MDVQVFGVNGCAETRKALRFFKERRITVHFVDFKTRGPSRGELRRFFQKLGPEVVVDRTSRRFEALGLRTAHYSDDRWIELAEEEPMILRTPLVRSGQDVTAGAGQAGWTEWVGR
jgi:arsenate reductase-like glutaredoxin family protein